MPFSFTRSLIVWQWFYLSTRSSHNWAKYLSRLRQWVHAACIIVISSCSDGLWCITTTRRRHENYRSGYRNEDTSASFLLETIYLLESISLLIASFIVSWCYYWYSGLMPHALPFDFQKWCTSHHKVLVRLGLSFDAHPRIIGRHKNHIIAIIMRAAIFFHYDENWRRDICVHAHKKLLDCRASFDSLSLRQRGLHAAKIFMPPHFICHRNKAAAMGLHAEKLKMEDTIQCSERRPALLPACALLTFRRAYVCISWISRFDIFELILFMIIFSTFIICHRRNFDCRYIAYHRNIWLSSFSSNILHLCLFTSHAVVGTSLLVITPYIYRRPAFPLI